MRIVKTSNEFEKITAYKMTKSPNIRPMKELAGQSIEVKEWCFYTDMQKGTEVELLSIMAAEGDVHATNSQVFMREFEELIDCFGEINEIKVNMETSKAGRDFIIPVLLA